MDTLNHLAISEKLRVADYFRKALAKTARQLCQNSWDLHNFFTSLGEVGHTVTIRRALGAGTKESHPSKNCSIGILVSNNTDDVNIEIKTKFVEPKYILVSPF